MKKIVLYGGKKSVMVDDEDYGWLSKNCWGECSGYASLYSTSSSSFISGKTILMHRVIMNTPADIEVDHIDGNKLNNQKSNLRNCTKSDNMKNRGKTKSNKTGYKGVTMSGNKYSAQIGCDHKVIHIGTFDTPEEAALAYNEKAKELHGEYAKLNEIK